MRIPLSARIALRYLFAKKSHSAVTAISAVSVCGIAVATAAIVCVLSVFNGFRNLLTENFDTLSPQVMITPAKGKTFASADSLLAVVRSTRGVDKAMPVVADNALVVYNGIEMPVMLKGVEAELYPQITSINKITLKGGRFATTDSVPAEPHMVYDPDIGDYVEMPAATRYAGDIAIGVASTLKIAPGSGERMLVFAPRRIGRVNTANPINSFLHDSISVAGVFQSLQNDFDSDYIITDIALARELFQYENECTAVEVKCAANGSAAETAHNLREKLGPQALVKDRLEQQSLNLRMVSIEKWVTFLLLSFILLVASFNIISTLSILVLDKQQSLGTLHALGASRKMIGAVFGWESAFVTLAGSAAGIVIGVILCLLQQQYGIIRLAGDPGTLIVKSYPVAVEASDLLFVMIPIALIGGVTALISSRFARSRV